MAEGRLESQTSISTDINKTLLNPVCRAPRRVGASFVCKRVGKWRRTRRSHMQSPLRLWTWAPFPAITSSASATVMERGVYWN